MATSKQIGWIRVTSDELLDANDSTVAMQQLLPNNPAIYLWKRNFSPPTGSLSDQVALFKWILRLTETSIADVHHISLSHFGQIEMLKISGTGLPGPKSATLQKFLNSPQNRKWILSQLRALATHTPALYTGESNTLRTRISQHLNGETNFGQKIEQSEHLDWGDLDLFYTDLGKGFPDTEAGSETRRALEYLFTMLTVSGMTDRPG